MASKEASHIKQAVGGHQGRPEEWQAVELQAKSNAQTLLERDTVAYYLGKPWETGVGVKTPGNQPIAEQTLQVRFAEPIIKAQFAIALNPAVSTQAVTLQLLGEQGQVLLETTFAEQLRGQHRGVLVLEDAAKQPFAG